MDYGKIISLIIGLLSGSGPLNDIIKLAVQLIGKIAELGKAPAPTMDVAWAQRALAKLGFDPGPIDNVLGPKTQAAIVKFQQARGLTADGWLGGETQTKLSLEAGDA